MVLSTSHRSNGTFLTASKVQADVEGILAAMAVTPSMTTSDLALAYSMQYVNGGSR